MKIWKAELILRYTEKEEYKTEFKCELQKEEYEVLNTKGLKFAWIKADTCVYLNNVTGNIIPMNANIERTIAGNLKIVQGFDHELNNEELISVKRVMSECMRNQLLYERDMYLKENENKLKAI